MPKDRTEYFANYRKNNQDKRAQYAKERWLRVRDTLYPPERRILERVRQGAKKRGIECTLTIEDIVIPTHCPVLGVPITYGKRPYSPSVDRIDNTKGYHKDNVAIISYRANVIKSDGTPEEHRAIADWMDSLT